MAARIQSIERAVAILRVLGSAPYDLSLQEVSDTLGLAKTTTHGILATLRHVGLVEQDRRSGFYRVTPAPDWLSSAGVDPHLLRSHAMNWADSLAATTGAAVLIGVPGARDVEVVHHVFRPDASPQTLMFGQRQPAHATALGKVLLANTGWWAVRMQQSGGLERYTVRTTTDRAALAAQVDDVRRQGWALEVEELAPDRSSIAAPIRAFGGLGVGAIALVGPTDVLCADDRSARPTLVHRVVTAARSVSEQLEAPR